MDGATEAQAAEPPPELPLAFQLAIGIPVFAVFLFFAMQWLRPRRAEAEPEDPEDDEPDPGAAG